jgi:hypothetical protein
MISWAARHIIEAGALLIVGVAALLTYGVRRSWPLLIPLPAMLAGLAWYGWEFSGEAAPFAAAILICGYVGIAVGAGFRRGSRAASRPDL